MAFLKPAQLNKFYEEYEAGRNKVWNRDEEMRKIEEKLDIEETEDGKYTLDLEGHIYGGTKYTSKLHFGV